MQSKISLKSRWALLFTSIIGIVFFLIGCQSSDTKVSVINIQSPQKEVESEKTEINAVEPIRPIPPSEPESLEFSLRLKIPKINVDAGIESVGLTPQGTMDIPKNLTTVGWYSLGSRPGETGTAVIDGHYGWWKNGTAGVFNDLNKLESGDKLYVEDLEKGTVDTFVVREIRSYDPSADASGVFASSDGKAHLNLITCEGVWDKTSKSYSMRLVIFTDKE